MVVRIIFHDDVMSSPTIIFKIFKSEPKSFDVIDKTIFMKSKKQKTLIFQKEVNDFCLSMKPTWRPCSTPKIAPVHKFLSHFDEWKPKSFYTLYIFKNYHYFLNKKHRRRP